MGVCDQQVRNKDLLKIAKSLDGVALGWGERVLVLVVAGGMVLNWMGYSLFFSIVNYFLKFFYTFNSLLNYFDSGVGW